MSNRASCLCGAVSWELLAAPYATYNCHCSMCRKAHGAAFGAYFFLNPGEIRLLSGDDKITRFRSSDQLVRSFCGACGSVVADPNDDAIQVAPAGCHDAGRAPDGDIFVADAAPWFDLASPWPRHDAYPDSVGLDSVARPDPGETVEGAVRGSCLCGAVRFLVEEPFKIAHNCHCSRCRRGRSTAHASNGFVSSGGVRFLSGEDRLRRFKVPDAQFFTQVSCDACGSLMPRIDHARGLATIPLGALDDDPGIRPCDHIYVADKAGWYEIHDNLPQFAERPPSH